MGAVLTTFDTVREARFEPQAFKKCHFVVNHFSQDPPLSNMLHYYQCFLGVVSGLLVISFVRTCGETERDLPFPTSRITGIFVIPLCTINIVCFFYLSALSPFLSLFILRTRLVYFYFAFFLTF